MSRSGKAAAGHGIASNVPSTNAPGAMNRSWAASGERWFVKEPYRKRRNNGSDKTLAPERSR
jgi:hypothetical protein